MTNSELRVAATKLVEVFPNLDPNMDTFKLAKMLSALDDDQHDFNVYVFTVDLMVCQDEAVAKWVI